MKYDVMAVGDVFADVVIVGREKPEFGQVEKLADTYEIELGGSAPIFASQFAKLGGKTALLSVLGDDILGAFVEQRMRGIGIDTRHVTRSKTRKTPLGLNISIDGDRSMLTVLGSLLEISSTLASAEIVNQTRHWHIASYFLLEQLIGFWPSFLDGLKKRGITVSLDTNWAPAGNWRQVVELLPRVDVFLPNENEAMAITSQSDYRAAGMELARICRLVVVKRGADGASAFVDGKEVS
jgi:sugar/nucleoside kinase (ribokinase family)